MSARWRRLALLGLCMLTLMPAGGSAATVGTSYRIVALRLVDRSREAHFANGTSGPRVLVTYVRYPSSAAGPLPLIVFAHGFATTPARYAALMNGWAQAGYVVAAPVLPVESAGAPGGPDESDLRNEPGDLSFVISRLLARGGIDPSEIAVAGHSDGAEAAFSVAYDRRFVDRRIRAAVVLSGAEYPGFRLRLSSGSPALLAVQGTRDAINDPKYTRQLFEAVPPPKFLLWLDGAGHMPPYTSDARLRTIVLRTTVAFLDRYLRGDQPRPLLPPGARGVALVSDPRTLHP